MDNEFQGFGGFGGFGRQNTQPTADELIAAAVAQGGELGRAAERLQNPKKAFFATMTEKAAGALDSFVSTLLTPMYSVAGLMDPDQTVAEAVRNRTSPGDVLMQRPDMDATTGERARYQLGKFAIDTMLDPLTYLTFGASRGVVGLARGTQFIAGEQAARVAGKRADMYAYLSPAGEAKVNQFYQAKLSGLRNTYLKNERVKMAREGVPEGEITRRLTDIDNRVSDSMIKEALNSPIDRRWATDSVAKLMEKFPHLASEWVDRGGIKFFGVSLLSAQRIKTIGSVIPGMTLLDRAFEPIRKLNGKLFSTKYSGGERMTDRMVEIMENQRLRVQSQTGHLVRHGARLKKQLDLTDNEWDFVTAAIEKGVTPRDPRGADLWRLHFGETPANGTIPDNVWRGIVGVEKMVGETRDALVRSGIRVPDHENYLPHLLVKQDMANISGRTAGRLTQTTNRTEFAKISALIGKEGERIPVRMKSKPDADGNVTVQRLVDGEVVEEQLKFVNQSRELRRIENITAEKSTSIKKAIEDTVRKIQADTASVRGSLAVRATDEIQTMFKGIDGLDSQDIQSLTEAMTRLVRDTDVEKVVSGRLKRFYKDGVRISGRGSVSEANIEQLIQEASLAKNQGTFIASRLNKLLAAGPKLGHQTPTTPAQRKAADAELSKLAKQIKDEANKVKQATLSRKMDTKAVEDLLKQVVAVTSKNPRGLNQVIDRIIKNKQVASDLRDELSDVSRAYRIERDNIIEEGGRFVSETGKSFERARARIDEARKFGVDFEENALAVALMSSKEAIDVTAARFFIKDVSEQFGVRQSAAPRDWRPMADLGVKIENTDVSRFITTNAGEDIFFHPQVVEQVQNFTRTLTRDENISDVLRAYDTVQNYFKAAVTSIWPAFHGRNALSNVFLMYNKVGAEVLNPVNHVATANFLNMERQMQQLQRRMVKSDKHGPEHSALMLKEVFTDKTGYRWSYGELRSQMMDQVVSFHPRNVGMTDQLRFGVKEVHEAKALMFPRTKAEKARAMANKGLNPFNSDNYLFKGGFKIGQGIEDYSRTLTFLAQLKHTGDPIQAAQITKQALFDYSNLTNFEKEFMRRIVPFYTFSRKNLELQLNTLVTNPGRISQQIRAVQTVGDSFRGEQLSEEEMAALPEWAKQGYNIVTKREGSHLTLLRTLGTPIEELFNRTSAHANIGMISPILKAPLEFGLGYSTFHGRPISEVTNADAYQFAPDFIKDFIGYEEVTYKDSAGNEQSYHTSFRPEMMYLINTLQPSGRLFSEINRLERTPGAREKLGALLFGFGVREFDLERESERRETERRQELEKLLDQAGLGYSFSRFVRTDQD